MTTRLVVLADTHIPRRARALPREVMAALERADLIVHLGDFTEIELVQTLQDSGRLAAIHGNNDAAEIRTLLPATRRLTIHGHRLVLIHGDAGGRTALGSARGVEDADVVLFGHSHQPYCVREGERLLFNPGSPTDRRRAPHRSFGILDVSGEGVVPSLVDLP